MSTFKPKYIIKNEGYFFYIFAQKLRLDLFIYKPVLTSISPVFGILNFENDMKNVSAKI